MKNHLCKRLLSLVLAALLCLGNVLPAAAAGVSDSPAFAVERVDNSEVSASVPGRAPVVPVEIEEPYAATDTVRVSVVLGGKSTLETAAAKGVGLDKLATSAAVTNYRAELEREQAAVTAAISRQALDGQELDVVWNLTLAANIISANVPYGSIEAIKAVPGVQDVLVETRYEPAVVDTQEAADPNMATSGKQTGSSAAWAAGYTGAGTRIAIIDTGTDIDHLSFDASAFEYALGIQAEKAGMTYETYVANLDLLDAEEILAVADQLNVEVDATAFINSKVAFGYNYVDGNYIVNHLGDAQGEHGSHVSGIAAANAYVANGDGTYAPALDAVYVQGVAPDAQLMTMKVFGASGGAYDSDYMAAIEDAIILGADAVNLSLGSASPGMARNTTEAYQAILDSLAGCGVVVTMSAGNAGYWAENAANLGYLYADDVNMQTGGSPGSFTNSLAVASVDNDGGTGNYVKVGETMVLYTESTGYSNAPMTTVAGDYPFVLIDGFGTAENWDAAGLTDLSGRIALVSRGETSFFEKANEAASRGAAAVIVYNNQPGIINMDLTGYNYEVPCVSITQADGAAIKALADAVTDEEGNALYYTGTMTVGAGIGSSQYHSAYYTMSDFSSWGVTGALELKPEITATGGSIYSVAGAYADGTNTVFGDNASYEIMSGTSMAAPQVAGMAALVAQYIRETGLEALTGMDARTLAQSLLMSTAKPVVDGSSGTYYPVIQQGAGLANVGAAVSADSYILMGADATDSHADGKVKAELGDDPEKEGVYSFSFTVNNLTGQERAYTLSADFFTQDVFTYYANGNMSEDELALYMDTLATDLAASAVFTVEGKAVEAGEALDNLDFNGDGAVNTLDGQALLDYTTGLRAELTNAGKADLDADGDVDSHDAYLFFDRAEDAVLVPANGSVNVTVTVTLTEEDKAFMDACFPGGTYVQGYVWARGVSSAEGVEGTAHSIPVLGFYGSWTDASMYEVGSYLDYTYGDENRLPYLGSTAANAYLITYASEPNAYYAFGGNPMVPDETYMPERNAINGENGDQISKMQFAAIRNAADSRFTIENTTTGELLMEVYPGEITAAFYYTSAGAWYNTGYSLNTRFTPDDASENDVLKMGLTLAPEYYVDAEGSVAWDALGDGATYGMTVTVDNTAPELDDVKVDVENNTLVVTAKDNQYISAVALYNPSGSKLYAYTGSKADAKPGEAVEFTLDISGLNGKKFLVQVTDYALNTATYKIEQQIGEPIVHTGRMYGFTTGSTIIHGIEGNTWLRIDPETLFCYYKSTSNKDFGGIEVYSDSAVMVLEAEYVDGYVFMAANDGYVYAAEQDDLYGVQKVGSYGDQAIVGMAMNHADGKMYVLTEEDGGVYVDEKGKERDIWIMTVGTMDLFTGEITELYDILVTNPKSVSISKNNSRLHGLAIDDSGNFYSVNYGNSSNSFLYTWTNETAVDGHILLHPAINNSSSGYTGYYGNLSSLAWDHDNDVLYMAAMNASTSVSSNNYLVTLDTQTGKGTKVNDYKAGYTSSVYPAQLRLGLSGLYIVPTESVDIDSGAYSVRVELSRTEAELMKGNTISLAATVYPWLVPDKSVTWTSSDESVVSVNQYGMVTAKNAGEAVVTATSTSDPSAFASCAVTVVSAKTTISGVLQDDEGSSMFFAWDLEKEDTWTPGVQITPSLNSATLDPVNQKLYVVDAEAEAWNVHQIDMATGETLATAANNTGVPMWDLAYSRYFSTAEAPLVSGVYYYYFLAPMDPMNMTTRAFDLSQYLNTYTGAQYLTAAASGGHFTYEDPNTGDVFETELFYLLDNAGYLWAWCVYEAGGSYSAKLTYFDTTLPDLDFAGYGEDMYCSMVESDNGDLYLSYFTGSTNEIYCLSYDAGTDAFAASLVGDVGDDVWPAALYSAKANVESEAPNYLADGAMDAVTVDLTETQGFEKFQREASAPAGSTNSAAVCTVRERVVPLSDTEVNKDAHTVTLSVTAKDATGKDLASTNGEMTVTYDAEMLTYTGYTTGCDHVSVNATEEGTITFAYVALEGVEAEDTVIELTFTAAEGTKEETALVVTHEKVNNDVSGYAETVTVPAGEWCHVPAAVAAVEPTCTENGSIAYWHCEICGKNFADEACTAEITLDDTVIGALGHQWGDWQITAAPTCMASGERIRFCGRCGAHETEPIPALDSCPSAAFTDLELDAWYHEATDYVLSSGLMIGMSDTIFNPAGETNRAQFITVLYRLAGCPSVEGLDIPFTDVEEGAWYVDALTWAYHESIVNGTSATTFAPAASITREQIAAILFRCSGAETVEEDHLSAFPDADMVSGFALDAMNWAVASGLVIGMDDGTLAPQFTANRAQIATLFMRFSQK